MKTSIVAGMSLALILAVSMGGEGAQKKGKKPNNPNSPIISQLQGATALLRKADHDYKGHRVKAIKEIHIAIKALSVGKNPKHPKVVPGNGKLPQDVSDGLLQQALKQLQATQTVLANSQGPGNRVLAATALQNAVTELQTALKIK